MKRGPQAATTVLMVLGFAAIVAVVVWRSRAEPRDASTEQNDAPTRVSPAPEPADTAAELPDAPDAPADSDRPADALPTPTGTLPSFAPQNAPGVEPFSPEVRDHARQMIVPTTKMAIERGDVKHLYEVLTIVQQHRGDQILPESDIGVIEAAIACLERAPDAREEAADLLRFGPPTQFAESLKKACNRP